MELAIKQSLPHVEEVSVWPMGEQLQVSKSTHKCLLFIVLETFICTFPIFKDRQKSFLLYRDKNLTFSMQIL